MNNQAIRCNGDHTPSFVITFKISSREYHVCNSCAQLSHYSRGIKNKITISEFESVLSHPHYSMEES